MPSITPSDGATGLKPALKTSTDDDNSSKAPSSNTSPPKGPNLQFAPPAVQIADPEPEATPPDETSYRKQFNAGLGSKRLSGRMPLPTSSSKSSLVGPSSMEDPSSRQGQGDGTQSPSLVPSSSSATLNSVANLSGDSTVSPNPASTSAPNILQSASQGRHKHHHAELLVARVGDWIEHERKKISRRKDGGHPLRNAQSADGQPNGDRKEPPSYRERADSIDSQSSEVSFDRLQKILEEGVAAMGLASIPSMTPLLKRRSSGRLRRGHTKSLQLQRVPSSDTDQLDSEIVVPTCEAVLDNSKAMSYSGGNASTEDLSASSLSKRESKGRQAWLTFKNEVIRLAHTLRLKGWRSVPLDGGEKISVERLSGALTNAVYVVSPPKESDLIELSPSNGTSTPIGKKGPKKLLLRIYGPHVDQLIDRESELAVLRRLAKKKIGPRLLGTFTNGRFEEYFNASPLNPRDLRDPETSKQIAKRMRELHDGVELLETERDNGPNVWRNWDRWLDNVGKRASTLDALLDSGEATSRGTIDGWRSRGYVCGVSWPKFKSIVDKYREHVDKSYGEGNNLWEQLTFAHNDTQYGNILRVRPDDQKSPLLQPANKHKQLIVIDFEYAAANVVGLEFANHFTEWCYNYHDTLAPFACDSTKYPTPEEQYRFIKAYVDHRPQFPHAGSTPRLTPLDTPQLPHSNSASSIVDFMLDARSSSYNNWREEEKAREEQSEKRVKELQDETRLWRPANSAQWVAWGIIQAKMPRAEEEEQDFPVDDIVGEDQASAHSNEGGDDDEFDYIGYAQERAYFFLGDCVQMGIVAPDELPENVRQMLKIVEY
ncbi:hypothetical protein jhhlp_004164 [Lomentospora prolificans]|uniref:Choline kinase N-terminal domain-containing protein n=1 Tax=Lomentospora prolificans TaxID=41688 RepID=A0A2N3NAW9_9PEZI|nr:hypothetical protein jhhlp_004164 [Lomentospora prolificans]